MAKKAPRSPSKGTKAIDATTEPPNRQDATQGHTGPSVANVTFARGDSVEMSLPSEVAEACFTLATGVKCPQAVASISLTPPRKGRASVMTLRFVTDATAGEFVESVKSQG